MCVCVCVCVCIVLAEHSLATHPWVLEVEQLCITNYKPAFSPIFHASPLLSEPATAALQK